MNKILATGVTGHLGKIVANQLLTDTAPENIVALVRDEQKAGDISAKGIELRVGDFDDKEAMEKALQGIGKGLLISGTDPVKRFEQHKNVVDAAAKQGVKHIVYTSVSLKDFESSANQFLIQSHFQTEEYIKQSGLGYTFFRNSLYTDVIPMYAGEHVFETGITAPAGDGKTAFSLRSDIGKALAKVLVQDGHEYKIYDITGNQNYSFDEVAKTLSELSGKDVAYNNLPVEVYKEQLEIFGVPEEFISVLVAFATDIKNGQHEKLSNDLVQLLGHEPANLKQGLKEIYGL